jgi:glycosyltransferase involved in cell wall biosynthesis
VAAFDPTETWVVVPAFNEASVIAGVVRALIDRRYKVIVVDDGSSDQTSPNSWAAGAMVIRHALNVGQGAALRTGMEVAQSRGAQYICTYDADGQHNPDDLQALLQALIAAGADVALGSRFLGRVNGMPFLRRLLLKGGILFTRLHAGIALTDTHNGLRVFTRQAAALLRIEQPRMAHASEILVQIANLKLRFVEVPVTVSYSQYSLHKGQSAFGSLRVLVDLFIARALR